MRLSPEARRAQLLACAVKSFAAHGLVAANHAMVATVAQVSVPTVFFYFKTREVLVDAVLTEVERFYMTNMAAAGDNKLPAAETLMQVSQQLTQTLETHPDYARIMMEWSVSVRSDIWPRYLRVYRRMNKMLAKVIERGQREGSIRPDLDPNDEAAILHAGSTALIQMMERGASTARLDQFQRAIVQSVLVPGASKDAPAQRSAPAAKKRVTKPKSDAPAQ